MSQQNLQNGFIHQGHVDMQMHDEQMHSVYSHQGSSHHSSEQPMDECSRETVEVLDSGTASDSGDEQLHHPADHFFNKNQEFDDLMDVLRDDQGEFCIIK